MKCPVCDVEMIDIFGWSMYDPCAISFRGNDGSEYGSDVSLAYCPECGRVRAIVKEKETK